MNAFILDLSLTSLRSNSPSIRSKAKFWLKSVKGRLATFKTRFLLYQFSTVQSLSHVWLFRSHGLQNTRLPCPLQTTRSKSEVKVKVIQSCLTLCNPMDYTVHGILQTRILEWVAFPFSRGSSQPKDQTLVSLTAGGFFTSWATREAQEYLCR